MASVAADLLYWLGTALKVIEFAQYPKVFLAVALWVILRAVFRLIWPIQRAREIGTQTDPAITRNFWGVVYHAPPPIAKPTPRVRSRVTVDTEQ